MTFLMLIIMASTMSCPLVTIINQTGEEMNDLDRVNLKRATEGCKEHYPNSPCLKIFYKRDVRSYAAICGAMEEGEIRK